MVDGGAGVANFLELTDTSDGDGPGLRRPEPQRPARRPLRAGPGGEGVHRRTERRAGRGRRRGRHLRPHLRLRRLAELPAGPDARGRRRRGRTIGGADRRRRPHAAPDRHRARRRKGRADLADRRDGRPVRPDARPREGRPVQRDLRRCRRSRPAGRWRRQPRRHLPPEWIAGGPGRRRPDGAVENCVHLHRPLGRHHQPLGAEPDARRADAEHGGGQVRFRRRAGRAVPRGAGAAGRPVADAAGRGRRHLPAAHAAGRGLRRPRLRQRRPAGARHDRRGVDRLQQQQVRRERSLSERRRSGRRCAGQEASAAGSDRDVRERQRLRAGHQRDRRGRAQPGPQPDAQGLPLPRRQRQRHLDMGGRAVPERLHHAAGRGGRRVGPVPDLVARPGDQGRVAGGDGRRRLVRGRRGHGRDVLLRQRAGRHGPGQHGRALFGRAAGRGGRARQHARHLHARADHLRLRPQPRQARRPQRRHRRADQRDRPCVGPARHHADRPRVARRLNQGTGRFSGRWLGGNRHQGRVGRRGLRPRHRGGRKREGRPDHAHARRGSARLDHSLARSPSRARRSSVRSPPRRPLRPRSSRRRSRSPSTIARACCRRSA